jgi:hypothetical protein
MYLNKLKQLILDKDSSKNIIEKYMTNNYYSDTMTQVWLAITTPT